MSAERLDQAVGGLYATFAAFELGAVAGCPHCVDGDDQREIRRVPLRELTGDDLGHYAFKAVTTWGDADDLRHFLPRLLELAAHGALPVDLAVVLGKLRLARWSQWPEEQRDAIEAFAGAWWRHTLAMFPAADDAATVLQAIGQAVDDLSLFLSGWLDPPGEPAVRHLAAFVDHLAYTARRRPTGLVLGGWWHDQPAQLLTWLARPAPRDALENAFFEAGSAPIAAEMSAAVDQLAWLTGVSIHGVGGGASDTET
ncbi:hypothetical protein [Actinoplanes subtropicus]|uniref:hypothetical protein n=1 Tax=Actinoplanes subtropicus TaxID=543632 RepID=UPI0004C3018C|nr:hypothetical protein [Actinoplanes subtropicus]